MPSELILPSLLCVPRLFPFQFLYTLGARRFLVVKTQALGCVPYVRSFYPKPFPSHCVQLANALGLANNFFYARALASVRRSRSDAAVFEFKWYELWQAVYVRPQAFGECHGAALHCTAVLVAGLSLSLACAGAAGLCPSVLLGFGEFHGAALQWTG